MRAGWGEPMKDVIEGDYSVVGEHEAPEPKKTLWGHLTDLVVAGVCMLIFRIVYLVVSPLCHAFSDWLLPN